jgi:hypothetical protein
MVALWVGLIAITAILMVYAPVAGLIMCGGLLVFRAGARRLTRQLEHI